jgi:hypothetical protein
MTGIKDFVEPRKQRSNRIKEQIHDLSLREFPPLEAEMTAYPLR